MNGKVRLGPAPFLAELPNALPESQADIFSCHAISMAVFLGLHFAYRIQFACEIILQHRTPRILEATGHFWLIM